ncbi:MAG: YcbK family protein [Myxococcales bacterium]|nr:YcbK family protein [Myxococcales bacterium]
MALVIAASAAAFAQQPQARVKRTASASVANHAAGPSIAGYMAGRQSLVGWHAPSERAIPVDDSGRPMLSLTTLNRGESLEIPACTDTGGFNAADLDRVAHLLRAGSGDEHPIDPRTLALVYQVQTHFGAPEIRVISGYRVPRPGSHSNHGRGRAVDFAVPGVPDEEVARFVRGMGFVGVGVYPASQFVHVDVRPRSYFWVDVSGPHMRNREQAILLDLAASSDADAIARGQPRIEPFVVGKDVEGVLRARGLGRSQSPSEDDEEDEN